MYFSRIRPWLFQLNSQDVCRMLKSRYLKQKCLFRNIQSEADPKVLALRDKLLYCDYLDLARVRMGYKTRLITYSNKKKLEAKLNYEKLAYEPVYSVVLNNQIPQDDDQESSQKKEDGVKANTEESRSLYMPYAVTDSYEIIDDAKLNDTINETSLNENYLEAKESNLNVQNSSKVERNGENNICDTLPQGELWKVPKNWMFDYEQYDDTPLHSEWYRNYGTPDPNSKVSSIPCSGCGALLHCKDPSFPGYVPSELFSHEEEDLKLMVCQRCHFLKHYKATLKVNVSVEDYPKLLKVIKRKKCAIILVVDLTDFPCSIWPDLKSIMHPFTPIFLVGNKIDLLPKDCSSSRFLNHIKEMLASTVIDITGISRENIMHVELISARTKFGVEELINKLQHKWTSRGDVYLVGCTNVGKSTLFNTLLNSDYCKPQAIDLIPRATVSPWPGTTLNLLKFPLLYPSKQRIALRIKRLQKNQVSKKELLESRSKEFKKTRDIRYATLIGNVGRTFYEQSKKDETADPFMLESHKFMIRKPTLDESRPEFISSRWCYDTPGTVQRDQILNLLTIDELILTLPKSTMSPRTFNLKPKETVFVAGLGRLDYLEGEYYIRCTLFTSRKLPLTICRTVDADEVYDQLLESEAFVVPINNPERLKVWPKLGSKEFNVTGLDKESAADVVLSNAGWIAITPCINENVVLKAWTPEGRGIHLRRPALLRRSVHLRGWKVQGTPMYLLGRQAYVTR